VINLRYHIVSLAAAFLAFGLGVLAGTTVINQGLVRNLEQNTRALRDEIARLDAQAGGLAKQVDLWERFGESVVPPLLRGRLAGRSVVLLAHREAPGDLLDELTQAMTLANARRPTRLTLTGAWALADRAATQRLADALGVPAGPAPALTAIAAVRLGARLGGSSDARRHDDLLRRLERAGFLEVTDLPDAGPFPAANAVVVAVPSPARGQVPDEDGFWLPLLRELAATRIVAVAEPMAAAESLAERVRGDRELARTVGTVDHADTVAGRLSLVYALHDAAEGRPADHYGTRGGATAVAPAVG
jgi:hypothetical protein